MWKFDFNTNEWSIIKYSNDICPSVIIILLFFIFFFNKILSIYLNKV